MGIFGNAFGWPHLVVILLIVLLLFGAPKLPALARSLGQSMRIFRGEMKTMKDEKSAEGTAATDAAAPVESVADASGTDSSAPPKK